MFVRDFIEIRQPFEAVAPQLVRNPAWLDPIAHDALEEAIAILGALRSDQPVRLGLPPVNVQCARGPVRLRNDALVMPLRWDTNPPTFVLPSFDGDLEVVPLGADRSQIALNATTVTSPDDRDAITRRVVETGLRCFLRRLAARLDRTA